MRPLWLAFVLAACGEDTQLYRVCSAPPCAAVEVTTVAEVDGLILQEASVSNAPCGASAVVGVGGELTRRLRPGESDLGIVLVDVQLVEEWPRWRAFVCRE